MLEAHEKRAHFLYTRQEEEGNKRINILSYIYKYMILKDFLFLKRFFRGEKQGKNIWCIFHRPEL